MLTKEREASWVYWKAKKKKRQCDMSGRLSVSGPDWNLDVNSVHLSEFLL